MPCKRCANGKWKWGERGACIYDTKADCEKAHPEGHDGAEADMVRADDVKFWERYREEHKDD